ncbi:MAG: indole-3-glycerol phosphate synthase TrpC [Rickettsiales bacterium]|nr:indole-3-glycerol phosphate synthase TrpC [Rickettsiales bacterium]
MRDVLAEICAKKRDHVAACKKQVSLSERISQAKHQAPPRGFRDALQKKCDAGGIGLIAEVKKASPSQGLIRADFHPATLAQAYENAGAACVSVLTDTPYFQGTDADFIAARAAIRLPMIRKDFMVDPYQVAEARAMGADCILLIVAALSRTQAQEIEAAAIEFGIDVLIETHDQPEVEVALSHLQSRLIGVNNRNLRSMQVSLSTTEALAPMIPPDYLVVCESGIHADKDIARVRCSGVHCFLIGESLMRQPDVERATRELISAANHESRHPDR